MGRIFSFHEIEQKEIPRPESFSRVSKQIDLAFDKSPGIIGGIKCGSVVMGGCNERSDFDCVVLYDSKLHHETKVCLQELVTEAEDLYVPLEFIPIDREIALGGQHRIDLGFARHLDLARRHGGAVKKDPYRLLNFDGRDKRRDVCDYLAHKLSQLSKGEIMASTMDDADLYKFLRKVMEAPVRVARKFLWWKGEDYALGDSKDLVVKAYLEKGPNERARILDALVGLDEEYNRTLRAQIARPDKKAYLAMVERLVSEAIPGTIEFVRANVLALG